MPSERSVSSARGPRPRLLIFSWPDRLAEVVADRRQRVEPGHRFLEDHARGRPRGQPSSPWPTVRPRLPPSEVDLAVHGRAARGQPEQPPTQGRFAAAALTDQAEHLTTTQCERDAVDGLHRSAGARVPDPQIDHIQDRSVGIFCLGPTRPEHVVSSRLHSRPSAGVSNGSFVEWPFDGLVGHIDEAEDAVGGVVIGNRRRHQGPFALAAGMSRQDDLGQPAGPTAG